jgi:exosortase family protein XrtG
LLYYLLAAFGLTFFIVIYFQGAGIDLWLEELEVSHTAAILGRLGMEVNHVSNQLFIPTVEGWAILVCALECSALFELAVLFSLMIFYLRFSPLRKGLSIIFGLATTYVANLLRLVIIASITNKFGEEYIFMAHTVVGRLLFFGLVLFIYWYLITRPSIISIGKSLVEKETVASAKKGGH